MAEEHFRITADASGVQAAAASVSRSLNRMIATVRGVNSAGAAGGDNWARKLNTDLGRTQQSLRKFSMDAIMQAQAVDLAWKKVGVTLRGLAPVGFGGRKFGPGGVGVPGAGVPGGWRPEDRSILVENAKLSRDRYRPLFGNRLALDQGQEMQNAFAAFLPMLALGAVGAYGINTAIQENVSSARYSGNLDRMGVSGNRNAVIGEVRRYTGLSTSADDIRKLVEQQVIAGETDLSRASANARLGLDLEASGVASATEFINALSKDGPEAAAAMKQIAENAGLDVPDGANLADMIAMLEEEFKGFAGEMKEARGSWGEMFATLKENMGILMDWGADVGGVDAVTAGLQGEFGKGAFLQRNSGFGSWAFGGMLKDSGLWSESVDDVRDSAFDRVSGMLDSGQITQAEAQRINEEIRKVSGQGPGGERDQNLGRLWDIADTARPIPGAITTDSAPGATPDKAFSTPSSPRLLNAVQPANEVRVVIQGDVHNPSPFSPSW